MSRTYRRAMLPLDCNCGAPIGPSWAWRLGWDVSADEIEREIRWSRSRGVPPNRICNCSTQYDYYSRMNLKRDRKDWYKPDKVYKTVKKRLRRAKERSAMARGDYDNIPLFRKSDKRDWL